MAVDPQQLDEITATVSALYREAETALVRIIARHLAGDLDGIAEAPAWADRKLAAVGALRRSTQAVIAGLQAAGEGAVRDAAAEAFRNGWRSALAELPKQWFPQSGLDQEAQQAAEEIPGFAAIESLAAAVHRDVGEKSRNILRDVLDAYRNVITATVARTLTGVQTRRQASQAAWQALINRGITGFTDRAGRRWQLSSYVEMAVRTVTQRAAVQGQTDRLQALGVQLVMVSNAPQECELCRPWEGRVLTLGGPTGDIVVPHELTDEPITVHVAATLAEAQLRGLFHPNCRHSVSAYLPGVSRLPEQPTADPAGDEARQKQRALERKIRRHKLVEAGALDDQARKQAGAKVRAAQAELRDHLAAHPDLRRLRYREQIGAGNIPHTPGDPAGTVGPQPPQLDIDGNPATPPRPDNQLPDGGTEAAPAVDPDQLSIDDVRPREPKPEPEPPEPKPGDATLAQLLDVNDELTDDTVLDRLASGDGTDDERAEWAAATQRFNDLADAGSETPSHKRFLPKLGKQASEEDLRKLVRRRLGQLKDDQAQRAATLRAFWRELERRRAAARRARGMREGRRFRGNQEGVAWAMADWPLPQELKPKERQSIRAYTGNDYKLVNNGLRDWAKPPESTRERYEELVRECDAAFERCSAPEPVIVHRGVGRSVAKALGADFDDPTSMHALVGKVYVDPGYLSTSIGRKAAFSGEIYLMFRIPQGYPAMNAMPVSKYGLTEREILVKRNARFVIHAVYRKGPAWYIEAEFVPDNWQPGPDWTPDPYGDAWEGYQ